MKTLEAIKEYCKANTIEQVYKRKWVNVDLELTYENIKQLYKNGVQHLCIGKYDYHINELIGVPDGEFLRLNQSGFRIK